MDLRFFFLDRPHVKNDFHSSLASFPTTQKNRKRKNPCRELKMTKSQLNTMEAPLIVKAPNSQERPNITMMLTMLMRVLSVPLYFFASVACTIFLLLCFRSTRTTRTNTTMLNRRMAKMGPRKTPNQTPMWSKKQL